MPRGGEDIEDLLLSDYLQQEDRQKDPELLVLPDGTREWRDPQTNLLHNKSLPARLSPDGTEEWFLHGKRDRLDHGPTLLLPNGLIEYHYEDMLHNPTGPARVLPNGIEEWWLYDKLHREGGPAIINSHKESSYKSEHDIIFEFWERGKIIPADKGPFQIKRNGTKIFLEIENCHFGFDVYRTDYPDGTVDFNRDRGSFLCHIDAYSNVSIPEYVPHADLAREDIREMLDSSIARSLQRQKLAQQNAA